MGIDVTVTLQALHCIRQDRGSGGSLPFIWPAMVWINTSNATVIAIAPAPSQARVVLSNGMHNGDVASIPVPVGVMTRRFDDDLSQYKFIFAVVLWEKRDLSDDAIAAGFNVYSDAVQSAVTANLAGLASTDSTTNRNAVNAVKNSVNDTVQNAIRSRLTVVELLEVKAGILTPDTVIDSSSTPLSTMAAQSFSIAFQNPPENPSSVYNIDAALQLKPVICETELNAVNQDQVRVNGLEAQLRQLKSELAKAPVAEKKGILQDIDEFTKEQLAPAKAKLAKDTQALNACRAAHPSG